MKKKAAIKKEHIIWHNITAENAIKKLNSAKGGLTQEEVKKRLKKFGENKLPEEKRKSKLHIFLSQFKNPLIYILLIAAIISLFLGEFSDVIVITIAVVMNTLIGYIEEAKADQALNKIKKLIKQNVKVLRKIKNEEREIEIKSSDLVPGDIIILSSGDKIPADSRLIEINELKINEASLTGESMPVQKKLEILAPGMALAERANMVYMGTNVMNGNGRAVVCNTGINTELGKIALMVSQTDDDKTPLQLQLEKFSRMLSIVVLLLCLFILNIGLLKGFSFIEIFLTSVAIAVAAIPEGLVISLTIILALSMQRILKKNALVKKLIAAETLGSASIICMDKTGTITEGKMMVTDIHIESDEQNKKSHNISKHGFKNLSPNVALALQIGLMCNDAVVENSKEALYKWKILGEPTECALYIAAIQAGLNRLEYDKKLPKLKEIPFNSETKYMATVHKTEKGAVAYIKGAPEIITDMAGKINCGGKVINITEEKRKELRSQYEDLSSKGLRVLAVAYKEISEYIDNKDSNEEILNNIIFVGFLGLKDPLRKSTKETIDKCLAAGIRPIIITGDHRLTAKAILEEVGLEVGAENILEGKKLDRMTDEELRKVLKKINVYARVSPRHKLRIIDAWQAEGEVVAMTGDGVNDAPAIKSADIGIALGSGTDVARETADIILLDDSFKTIVSIIKQGRIVFDNIRKVTLYLLSDSFSEMILIIGSLIFGLPLPLIPTQILWINLITDGLPGVAMTMEQGEAGIEKEKPRLKNEPLLNFEIKLLIFIISIATAVILFFVYVYLLKTNIDLKYLRTLIFALLGTDSLIYVFSCKSIRKSIWRINLFSNKYLIAAIISGFIFQALPIYWAPLQKLLQTVPLSLKDWIIIFIFGIINIIAIEAAKSFFIIKRPKKKLAKNSHPEQARAV